MDQDPKNVITHLHLWVLNHVESATFDLQKPDQQIEQGTPKLGALTSYHRDS